jgi:hypothetical protein
MKDKENDSTIYSTQKALEIADIPSPKVVNF